MMIIREVKKVIGITVLSASLLFTSITDVANIKDTGFSFTLDSATIKYTAARDKKDISSTYI